MKRRTAAILTGLLVLVASPGFAQGALTYGPKVGINFADISLDPSDDECCDTKTGLAIGGFVDIGFRNIFSFQPEVLYLQKGAEQSFGADRGNVTEKININVIEIPLLAKANFQTSGPVRPFAVFGPGIAFRTSAKLKIDDDEEDIEDEVAGTDFSLIFGGGVTMNNFIVEARYDLGLSDLAEDEPGFDPEKVKSRTFTILFGYGFSR